MAGEITYTEFRKDAFNQTADSFLFLPGASGSIPDGGGTGSTYTIYRGIVNVDPAGTTITFPTALGTNADGLDYALFIKNSVSRTKSNDCHAQHSRLRHSQSGILAW